MDFDVNDYILCFIILNISNVLRLHLREGHITNKSVFNEIHFAISRWLVWWTAQHKYILLKFLQSAEQ